jgi:hypothetical protein
MIYAITHRIIGAIAFVEAGIAIGRSTCLVAPIELLRIED